jgi:mevalonate kinase
MKLKLVIAISALIAIPTLAFAQQTPAKVPKPSKADVQKVVQIVSTDKVKSQAYCDLSKLNDQMMAADQKKDTKALEELGKQADGLIDKLGPEYSKMMDGLDEVDENSPEGKEYAAILSGLDKLCAK